MKTPFTLALIFALAFGQALAQTAAQKEEASPTHNSSAFDRGAVELQVRRLTSKLDREPDDRECRLKLVSSLETLGKDCLEHRDLLNAWRYFDVAAHLLAYKNDKGWKVRAEQDGLRAMQCRQARMEYLSRLAMIGYVFVTFNWRKYKDLDPRAATDYTAKISLPIRRGWSVAKRMSPINLDDEEKPAIIVTFKIHRDGAISDVQLSKSSSNKKIDAIALQVIKTCPRLPPLLPGMGDVLPVEAQFVK